MSEQTGIEWTDSTWNPVTGCNKISPGCKNCYADRMAPRLKAMGNPRYANGFRVTLHHDLVDLPKRWRKPRRIFVNSMSDLFHEAVPLEFIRSIFDTIEESPRHTFQVLTKRPETALGYACSLQWPDNLWMGASVENQDYVHRVDTLRLIPAKTRFLSLEPLIGPIHDLNLNDIHWVITGGESGPGSRPIEPRWVQSIRDQCVAQDTPFFFKQWGGTNKKRNGRLLDGQTWDQFPARPDRDPEFDDLSAPPANLRHPTVVSRTGNGLGVP